MFKRKITKVTKLEMERMRSKKSLKELLCSSCSNEYVMVTQTTGSVICPNCVIKMVGGTGIKPKKNPLDKRPRGWHFKDRYVSNLGKKYIKGKEVEFFPEDNNKENKITNKPTEIPIKQIKKVKKNTITTDIPKRKRGRPPKNKN